MPNSGFYSDRLTWKKRTTTKDAIGQDVETFTDNGYLWASISQTSGREAEDYGAEQTGATATIRVRNYPALSPLDRLYSAEWGELYVLDSIRRGDNELFVEAHLYDDLDL